MIANILAATDFSSGAEKAVACAFELAARTGAKVHLLHVCHEPVVPAYTEFVALTWDLNEAVMKHGDKLLQDAAQRYHGRTELGKVLLKMGDAREVIVKTARDLGCDMIVMGTHGRRGFRHALMGSVAEAVVRTAPCAVLTVREPEHSHLTEAEVPSARA